MDLDFKIIATMEQKQKISHSENEFFICMFFFPFSRPLDDSTRLQVPVLDFRHIQRQIQELDFCLSFPNVD